MFFTYFFTYCLQFLNGKEIQYVLLNEISLQGHHDSFEKRFWDFKYVNNPRIYEKGHFRKKSFCNTGCFFIIRLFEFPYLPLKLSDSNKLSGF